MSTGSAATRGTEPPASADAGIRRRARVDLGVLAASIVRAWERSPDAVLDARANAYGHGLREVVAVALEAGVPTIRVSPAEAELAGTRRSRLMTVASASRPLIGESAYGLAPDSADAALLLTGEIVAVKRAEAGAPVSYGYTFRTERDTTLALVALGYADGVPRLASNRALVSIRGTRLPVVGRVAMDQFVVDCAELVPEVGEDAVLFGSASRDEPTASEWAGWTQRSALELTAGIGARVRRSYR